MTPPGPPRTPSRSRRPATPRPAERQRGVVARPRPAARRPGPARGYQRSAPGRRPVAPVLRPGRPRARLAATIVVMLVAFGVITVRLVGVQAVGGQEYTAFGASQRFQEIALPADRGSIFDRNGHDLAVSIPQTTIWADPRLVEDPAAVARELAPVLGLDAEREQALAGRLGREGSAFAYVERRVEDDVAEAVAGLELPGIFSLDEPERFSPAGDLGGSILGQVDVDNLGISGLEEQYDELLTGESGRLVIEKDPDGRTIPGGEQELEPAERGDDLVLTIDRSMQYEAERALAAQIAAKGAEGGIVIVSRPETGEILAMANMATDPETGEVHAVRNNMAVTTAYEPGSVNKVITVAAALEEGLVAPATEVVVPDSLQVSDHLFTDHDPHPTEPWSVTRILTESSNIGTIKLAGMLGKDRLDEYLRRFGLGERTALGFPYETPGIMLDPEEFSGTSMGSIPIGQGISVSAMQMLQAYNVLATDGVYVPPKLVMETVDGEGASHAADVGEPRRVVSQLTASRMREMLTNVVAEGTGTRGGIQGYTVAGKTGTARKPLPTGGYQDAQGYHYISTFAGFVPAERPELSIIVVIDEPTGDIYGGTVAAPVFADLAQYGLRLLRVPPPLIDRAPPPDTAAADAQATGITPQGTPSTTTPERVRAAAATSTTTTTTAPPTSTTTASTATNRSTTTSSTTTAPARR
jgi:cell division protein FtsI (penicillin-binding protein 3)